MTIGGAPATAREAFTALENNRLVGLLRLDVRSRSSESLFFVRPHGHAAAAPEPAILDRNQRGAQGDATSRGRGGDRLGHVAQLRLDYRRNLLQAGCVWISAVMLDGRIFSKTTAYIGLVMHGLDLAHGLIGLVAPSAGAILLIIAGPLYLVWFPLVARKLFQLSRTNKPNCNKLVVTA
jgi:hypothetical protein